MGAKRPGAKFSHPTAEFLEELKGPSSPFTAGSARKRKSFIGERRLAHHKVLAKTEGPSLLRRAPVPDVWQPPLSTPVPVYIDKDTHYEVNQILDSRVHKGRLQYLVDWKDFPSGEREWVEAANVKAPRLLRAFHRAFPECPRPTDAG
ncbi:uncharacterized protein LOC143824256 [Paroedura picta]|uniref:uncharacterized protein LOC143824256 n=1 Tax=Paroedura picta TaxID=143630 RepID=UPI004056D10F